VCVCVCVLCNDSINVIDRVINKANPWWVCIVNCGQEARPSLTNDALLRLRIVLLLGTWHGLCVRQGKMCLFIRSHDIEG